MPPCPAPFPCRTISSGYSFPPAILINCSIVSYADFTLEPHPRLVAEADKPALMPPAPGHFDSDGIGLGSVVRDGDRARIYYMGWSTGQNLPWRNAPSGLRWATWHPASSSAPSMVPVVLLSVEDPFTLVLSDGAEVCPDDWRMRYGSNLFWGAHAEQLEHHIKLKRSSDGINWHAAGKVVLPLSAAGEYIVIRSLQS